MSIWAAWGALAGGTPGCACAVLACGPWSDASSAWSAELSRLPTILARSGADGAGCGGGAAGCCGYWYG